VVADHFHTEWDGRDAVLVDPPLTMTQAAGIGDWIAASGRELRQIYVTHERGTIGSAQFPCCRGSLA
jgi:glyoxylase-like metal-dependent hydrolase (beta-lactamase superfamily II)